MYTIEYFDRENRYRTCSASDMEEAVNMCVGLERTTVGCAVSCIRDEHDRKYHADGKPMET